MRLEDVSAEIRPRTSWEAIDLGMALVRRDFGLILGAWLCTVLPFVALLTFLLWDWPFLLITAIFWFKPLYDRVPLFIISRSLFGARPQLGDVFKSPKFFLAMLIGDLTWRRFSFARSYLMPIGLLERLKGAKRRVRVSVLNRESDAHNLSLMTSCGMVEIGLMLAIGALAAYLLPMTEVWQDAQDWYVAAMADEAIGFPRSLSCLLAGAYFVGVSLVEPFYVGGGFGMYVNGRARSEGWDLELAFRRMEKRLISRSSKVAAAVLFMGVTCMTSSDVIAQRNGDGEVTFDLETILAETAEGADGAKPTDATGSEAREVANEVLEDEAFRVYEHSSTSYRWRDSDSSRGVSGNGVNGFAAIGNVIFWLVVVAAIAGLIYWIYQYRHVFKVGGLGAKDRTPRPRATTVMGMDVRPESLPDNIPNAAWEAWEAGRRQEALSLLYRGAISWMVEQERLPILESDTEDDCVDRARELSNAHMVSYFGRLTERWTGGAYGKLWPDDATAQQLCRDWPFRQVEVSSDTKEVPA